MPLSAGCAPREHVFQSASVCVGGGVGEGLGSEHWFPPHALFSVVYLPHGASSEWRLRFSRQFQGNTQYKGLYVLK